MKTKLKEIKPQKKPRLMDLVEVVGIDVSDWANIKSGKKWAAANPKYCYNWSFVNLEKRIIIVTLWYSNIRVEGSELVCRFNHKRASKIRIDAGQRKRAMEMDSALQMAAKENLFIRVIINDGERSENFGGISVKAKVKKRMLDSEPWHIKACNFNSGEYILRRGRGIPKFVDQVEMHDLYTDSPKKIIQTTKAYQRSLSVRQNVLQRAAGFCEWCGEKGFITASGAIYLESHHIIPLSEGGADIESNMLALCPNHHKKAHYAKDAADRRKDFLKQVNKLNEKTLS